MRKAGILLSITSLPSKYGIGCFSKEAYEFVDFLELAGQKLWQILPLGPTGFGDSPYQSFSTFAGNPYFIDLELLVNEGVLSRDECDTADFGDDDRFIDYGKVYQNRFTLLKKAYHNTNLKQDNKFAEFKRENAYWLNGYSVFMAQKEKNGFASWNEWSDLSTPSEEQIEFWEYLQYKFFENWFALKRYANKKGIEIIGDMPIYCAYDSADVRSFPNLFELDADGGMKAVSGCPPDGFSENGQLWGNPVYRWDEHKEEGYCWWRQRFDHCFKMYDILRIDHFRGFDEFYSIPCPDPDAKNGEWKKAYGRELFRIVKCKNVIAEDLGFITESVKELLEETGFAGTKVFEFGFDERDNNGLGIYLPHNYSENTAAYTATHDNEPVTSWFSSISNSERDMVRNYLWDFKTDDKDIAFPIISRIMQSKSRYCIVPIQDYLKFGTDSRMNVPSKSDGNWRWRIKKEDLTEEMAAVILRMTRTYGR